MRKLTVGEEMKTTDNKIEQNKAQYDFERESSKILLYYQVTLVNIFSICKNVLLEKNLLEKAATLNRFDYSSFGKWLKAQTDIEKK